MMSRLHVASFGLVIGSIGQWALYSDWMPRIPSWIIFLGLLPPWFVIYAISFCRQAPCGPRTFRHLLTFAMSWYAVITLTAEVHLLLFQPAPAGHFSNTWAAALMWAGALSYIVFGRTYAALRQFENAETSSSELG